MKELVLAEFKDKWTMYKTEINGDDTIYYAYLGSFCNQFKKDSSYIPYVKVGWTQNVRNIEYNEQKTYQTPLIPYLLYYNKTTDKLYAYVELASTYVLTSYEITNTYNNQIIYDTYYPLATVKEAYDKEFPNNSRTFVNANNIIRKMDLSTYGLTINSPSKFKYVNDTDPIYYIDVSRAPKEDVDNIEVTMTIFKSTSTVIIGNNHNYVQFLFFIAKKSKSTNQITKIGNQFTQSNIYTLSTLDDVVSSNEYTVGTELIPILDLKLCSDYYNEDKNNYEYGILILTESLTVDRTNVYNNSELESQPYLRFYVVNLSGNIFGQNQITATLTDNSQNHEIYEFSSATTFLHITSDLTQYTSEGALKIQYELHTVTGAGNN